MHKDIHHTVDHAEADLRVLPRKISQLWEGEQFTIGDLHGNALKLLYFLISINVFEMSAADYRAFLRLYQIPTEELNKAHILQLNQLLARIKIRNRCPVRLLGDEFCDRGANDYFTLKILEKLRKNGVPVQILISNHGLEFVEAWDKTAETRNTFDYLEAPRLGDRLSRSLNNLRTLVLNGTVREEEVKQLISRCYKPCLRPISYSLCNNSITLYSHAPIGLETIQSLATKLKLEYQDQTPEQLARTIDRINAHVQKQYIKKDAVNQLYDSKTMFDGFCGNIIDYLQQPFAFLAWNRRYNKLVRPVLHHNYNLFFVHGHDSKEITHENIHNMDNTIGKAFHLNGDCYDERMCGEFSILGSRTNIKPGLLQRIMSKVTSIFQSIRAYFFPEKYSLEPFNQSISPSTAKVTTVLRKLPGVEKEELAPAVTPLEQINAVVQAAASVEHTAGIQLQM